MVEGRTNHAPVGPPRVMFLAEDLSCFRACSQIVGRNWLQFCLNQGGKVLPEEAGIAPGAVGIHTESMPQAIMDPEKVRRFAEELQRFNREVEVRMATLQARFNALGDTWQDQEQVKFSDEFKQTMKALKKFIEVSGQQTPYLLRKAQRIEEYLNQR